MAGSRPYSLRHTLQNPLARMLPLSREQSQVYRLGEKRPPAGFIDGHAPVWEAISMVLTSLGTIQARVALQRDFHLLALTASTSVNTAGGFRAQLYDAAKQVRLADRGVPLANLAGSAGPAGPVAPFFLRDPYRFDDPDSQVLVVITNLEAVQNTVQLVLYGVCLPFNSTAGAEFPGGPVSSVSATKKKSSSSKASQ